MTFNGAVRAPRVATKTAPNNQKLLVRRLRLRVSPETSPKLLILRRGWGFFVPLGTKFMPSSALLVNTWVRSLLSIGDSAVILPSQCHRFAPI